ncbi:MAG: MFS transporter [Bacteroidales bacterium]|nr:MFS transporter [Bacteroidales bacterium]
MKQKPRLSFWQIWNMSFGFLGIQFGFALQNANVSRIFETLGARVEDIPILWIAAPVTGLIIQPIIGHMSDNTWNRLGRRRPYFLTGAILASLALLFMPNSPVLWIAAGMLWIMDASINISMEPFRAFVGDMLPSRQRTMGFAMQSFFIGTGAVVASALPYIMTNYLGIENTAPKGVIPPSVKLSFYIGAAVFFLAVLYTILRTKEYSPQQMKEFAGEDAAGGEPASHSDDILPSKTFINKSYIWIFSGAVTTFLVYWFKLQQELYILTVGLLAFGIIQLLTGLLVGKGKDKNGFVVVINDLFKMPSTMKQLAVVQFFSWFALFAMWIYTTAAVTSTKFDMKLDRDLYDQLQTTLSHVPSGSGTSDEAETKAVKAELDHLGEKLEKGRDVAITMKVVQFFNDETRAGQLNLGPAVTDRLNHINKEYNKGADWVGILMAVYNGFAAIMAFVIIALAGKIGRKRTHAISLLVGGLSLASFFLIRNPNLLIISELGIGLAWASILAMPYAILTGSLPQHKLGTYMGIFNFFIVIPQILAASILGFFVKTIAGGEAIYALILGGISMVIAAGLVLFVRDEDEKLR